MITDTLLPTSMPFVVMPQPAHICRAEYSHPDVQAGDQGIVTHVGVLSPFTMTPCLTVQLDRGFNVYPLVDDLELNND